MIGMTFEDVSRKYMDRAVDVERVEQAFRHMGKFGRITGYGFSFETESALIQAEVCVKGGKIVGLTPEKSPRVDEWGYGPEEYEEELTEEDCARLDLYLASVLA